MPRLMYDLAGADPAVRFSPYCWRARFALAHKGLEVDCQPWRFTEKDAIAFSGQGRVPVLVDGGTVVHDSWAIAEYLDRAYPDAPALFPAGPSGPTRFARYWADAVLMPALARVVVADIVDILDPRDVDYFRESREQRFGRPLQAFASERDENLAAVRKVLEPVRRTLGEQPWLAGDAPAYADHLLAGAMMWARVSSPVEILADDDTILRDWRERVLDLYDGLGRRAPARAA